MHTIFTVIKKELIDTLRDRRTLISAIVLPIILIPLLFFGATKLTQNLIQKEQTKKIKITFFGAPENIPSYFKDENIELVNYFNLADAKVAIEQDSLDAIIEFAPDFQTKVNAMETGNINVSYKTTETALFKRISTKLEIYKAGILQDRIQTLNISPEAINPINIQQTDMASSKEQLGQVIGGMLPYLFIIMCFLGCLYPALDLITGEKEKGTIETLLTVPASRFHILLGKMLAIALVGLAAAVMILIGLLVSLRLFPDVPAEFLTAINSIVSVKFVMMLFGMLIPLSIFFAGLLTTMVIRAKSFKEAQSYASPASFVVILPAALAMLPGMELTWSTVWIPILNVALATKEIVAETIQMPHYLVVVLSLVLLSILSILISYKQFGKESNVLN